MPKPIQIKDSLFNAVHSGEMNTADLVQIIEHLAAILNLKTLTNYAKENQITYNGAKHRKKQTVKIDKIKFVVDEN